MFADDGGFGNDGAAVAPHAVGDLGDEVFLEGAFGFEFVEEGVDEGVVFLAALFEVGRIDDDVGGVEAVGDGVAAGTRFALGGAGAGGFLGAFAVGCDFEFRCRHGGSFVWSMISLLLKGPALEITSELLVILDGNDVVAGWIVIV